MGFTRNPDASKLAGLQAIHLRLFDRLCTWNPALAPHMGGRRRTAGGASRAFLRYLLTDSEADAHQVVCAFTELSIRNIITVDHRGNPARFGADLTALQIEIEAGRMARKN